MLNVLASLAESEREVTAERVRDKIRATRCRGGWTGGPPFLGYDTVDSHLIVNEAQAVQAAVTVRG